MNKDYNKGWEEAFNFILKKLKDADKFADVIEYIQSFRKNEDIKKSAKPQILFTKLDADGKIVLDREKTTYYALHPEELEKASSKQSELFWTASQSDRIPDQSEKAFKENEKHLICITESDKKAYNSLLKKFVQGKTTEMCKAENALMFAEVNDPVIKADMECHPKYWNALGTQLSAMNGTPNGTLLALVTARIDPKNPEAVKKLLEKATLEHFLFNIV